jgi:hypothetical protein
MITASANDLGFARACALLLIANLADGLFTFTFLQLNVATEANPLMRWVYDHSPLSFMVVKLACVQASLLVLWQHRTRRVAVFAVRSTAAVYGMVVAYHCSIVATMTV